MPLFGKKKKNEDDKQEPAEESEQNGSGISLDNLDLSDDNDIEANNEQASELSILDSALEAGVDGEDDEDETQGDEDEALSQDLLDIFAGEAETDVNLGVLTNGLEDVDAASLLTQAQQVLALLKRNMTV